MRLFAAILLPPPVREVLSLAAERVKRATLSGRFTGEENWHLTLAFIGETQRIAEARRAVCRAAVPPFSLAVEGWGAFRRGGEETVWAGVVPAPELIDLQGQVVRALREEGFRLDERPFRPHITVARQVRWSSAGGAVPPPRAAMLVEAFSLMSSEREGGAPVYREVERCLLK